MELRIYDTKSTTECSWAYTIPQRAYKVHDELELNQAKNQN